MPRNLIVLAPLMACVLLSGCGGDPLADTKLFPSKIRFFSSQTSWGSGNKTAVAADLNSSGPVSPEDYVDANGQCSAVTPVPAPPSDKPVGSVAGDLAGASAPAPATPPTLAPGGVGLGMTECQVTRHAGQPGQVNIGANESSDRKVVLTYQSGPWPGIYTFTNGRLTQIDRVAMPEPVKPAKKNAKKQKSKTATSSASETTR